MKTKETAEKDSVTATGTSQAAATNAAGHKQISIQQVIALSEALEKYKKQVAHVSPLLRSSMITAFNQGLTKGADIGVVSIQPENGAQNVQTEIVSNSETQQKGV